MGDEEEPGSFAELVGDVRPLRQDRVLLKPKVERPLAREPEPEPLPDIVEAGGIPAAEFHRGGLQLPLLRKFRRGAIRPQRRIDLHGYYREHARRLLLRFIGAAVDEGLRCVLVIHGRGAGSEDGRPVLRDLAHGLLAAHPAVLAYCPAQPRDGATGASYVYLKARPGTR
jgi:DNA-nicking Smr family endonuclease